MWSRFLRLTQRRILLHGGDELLRRCNRAKLPLTPTKLHATSGKEKRRRAHRRFRSSSATWLRGSRPISAAYAGTSGPGEAAQAGRNTGRRRVYPATGSLIPSLGHGPDPASCQGSAQSSAPVRGQAATESAPVPLRQGDTASLNFDGGRDEQASLFRRAGPFPSPHAVWPWE